MANPSPDRSITASANNKPLLSEQQSLVADCVDALDGATLTGDTLTTSATPTVTELEANDGVLGGKINAILDILEEHGLMADA